MPEVRPIDANALMCDVMGLTIVSSEVMNYANAVSVAIANAPTVDAVSVVDAVEVVRCKDCEHQHTVHCPMVYEDLDYTGTFVIVRDNSFNDDGFCHRGTPKKGEP